MLYVYGMVIEENKIFCQCQKINQSVTIFKWIIIMVEKIVRKKNLYFFAQKKQMLTTHAQQKKIDNQSINQLINQKSIVLFFDYIIDQL